MDQLRLNKRNVFKVKPGTHKWNNSRNSRSRMCHCLADWYIFTGKFIDFFLFLQISFSSFKYIHDFILARLCLLCKHRTIFFLVFSLLYIRYILFRVKLYDKIIKNCERMKSNFRKIDNTNSRIFKYFGLVLHVSGALMRSSRETLNNHCNQITG